MFLKATHCTTYTATDWLRQLDCLKYVTFISNPNQYKVLLPTVKYILKNIINVRVIYNDAKLCTLIKLILRHSMKNILKNSLMSIEHRLMHSSAPHSSSGH